MRKEMEKEVNRLTARGLQKEIKGKTYNSIYNRDFQEAIDKALAKEKKRVFSFLYKGQTYYVKRHLANSRKTFWRKQADLSYYREFVHLYAVSQQLNLAPPLIRGTDAYFVMPAVGKNLQECLKETLQPHSTIAQATLRKGFYLAGQGLSTLHEYGFYHGRPALRDIVFDREEGQVAFIDWETAPYTSRIKPYILDLLIFVHSYFREEMNLDWLMDEAREGYCQVSGGTTRWKAMTDFMERHKVLLHTLHPLEGLGGIDLRAVRYMEGFLEG